jgi:hypothetical protein
MQPFNYNMRRSDGNEHDRVESSFRRKKRRNGHGLDEITFLVTFDT